jgi:hypothetical protein
MLASFSWLSARGSLKDPTLYRGRLYVDDLLIMTPCFVKKHKYIFNIKSSKCELVSTRSTVLILPLQ